MLKRPSPVLGCQRGSVHCNPSPAAEIERHAAVLEVYNITSVQLTHGRGVTWETLRGRGVEGGGEEQVVLPGYEDFVVMRLGGEPG